MSLQSSPSPQRAFARSPLASIPNRSQPPNDEASHSNTRPVTAPWAPKSVKKRASAVFRESFSRWAKTKSRDTPSVSSANFFDPPPSSSQASPVGDHDVDDLGAHYSKKGNLRHRKSLNLFASKLHFSGWGGVLPATAPPGHGPTSPLSPSTPTANYFSYRGSRTAPPMHIPQDSIHYPSHAPFDEAVTPTAAVFLCNDVNPVVERGDRRRSITDPDNAPDPLLPQSIELRRRHAASHQHHHGSIRAQRSPRFGISKPPSSSASIRSLSTYTPSDSHAKKKERIGPLVSGFDCDNPFAPSVTSSSSKASGLFAAYTQANETHSPKYSAMETRFRSGSAARSNLFGAHPSTNGSVFGSPAPPSAASLREMSGAGPRSRQRTVSVSLNGQPVNENGNVAVELGAHGDSDFDDDAFGRGHEDDLAGDFYSSGSPRPKSFTSARSATRSQSTNPAFNGRVHVDELGSPISRCNSIISTHALHHDNRSRNSSIGKSSRKESTRESVGSSLAFHFIDEDSGYGPSPACANSVDGFGALTRPDSPFHAPRYPKGSKRGADGSVRRSSRWSLSDLPPPCSSGVDLDDMTSHSLSAMKADHSHVDVNVMSQGPGSHGTCDAVPSLTDSSSLASSLNSSSQNHSRSSLEAKATRDPKRRSLPAQHVGAHSTPLSGVPRHNGRLNGFTLASSNLQLSIPYKSPSASPLPKVSDHWSSTPDGSFHGDFSFQSVGAGPFDHTPESIARSFDASRSGRIADVKSFVGTPLHFNDVKPSLAAFDEDEAILKMKPLAIARQAESLASPFLRGLVQGALKSAAKTKALADGNGDEDLSGDASFLENSFEGRLVNPAVAALASRPKAMPPTPMKSMAAMRFHQGAMFGSPQHTGLVPKPEMRRMAAGPSRLRTSMPLLVGSPMNSPTFQRQDLEGDKSIGEESSGASSPIANSMILNSALNNPMSRPSSSGSWRRRSSHAIMECAKAGRGDTCRDMPMTPTRDEVQILRLDTTNLAPAHPSTSYDSPVFSPVEGQPSIWLTEEGLSTPQITGGRTFDGTPPTRGLLKTGIDTPNSPAKQRPSMHRHSSSSYLETAKTRESQTVNRFDEEFERYTLLGSGVFGDVYRVVQRVTKVVFAVKRVKVEINGYKSLISNAQEVAALRIMSRAGGSPFVLGFVDAWLYESQIYIQTEFCEEGTLDAVLEVLGGRGQTLGEGRIWKMIAELVQGIHFIHGQGIAHLDIKPANVLITCRGGLKIGDFGHASRGQAVNALDILRDAGLGYFQNLNFGNHVAGLDTNDFAAITDELQCAGAREGDTRYQPDFYEAPSQMADVFSIGLIALEATCNMRIPGRGQVWENLRSDNFSDCDFSSASGDLTQLILRMLRRSKERRITSSELVEHHLIQDMMLMRLRGLSIESLWDVVVGEEGNHSNSSSSTSASSALALSMIIDVVPTEEETRSLSLGVTERPLAPEEGEWSVLRGAVFEEAPEFDAFLVGKLRAEERKSLEHDDRVEEEDSMDLGS